VYVNASDIYLAVFFVLFSPGYVKVVHGEGMPSTKAPGTKGDLKLNLTVKFPQDLSIQQKKDVRRVLTGSS
jgi:DnaJ-class molecular chaperone